MQQLHTIFVLGLNGRVKELENEERAAQLAEEFPQLIHFFAEFDTGDEYPHPDGPYTALGPECFTDGNVISWKGYNFYRACDQLVTKRPDGGATYCVKRANHPSNQHEDFEGTTCYA